MRSSDRLVGSASRPRVEHFREARLVRIAHGGFAICLHPFGMLDPQVMVNLLPELGVGLDLVRHGHWLDGAFKCGKQRLVYLAWSVSALCSETNELHKQPFIWG